MNQEIPKVYDPAEVEKKWYRHWLDSGYFHAEVKPGQPRFSIVIPPPNVTGALHIGHAYNNTVQDIYTRFKRMQGHTTLWTPGTDHAGIATQTVVEKQLKAEGTSRQTLGRERFVEEVWKHKVKYRDRIVGQLQEMGCSCDWDREWFTMDETLSRAVTAVFVHFYKKGWIYKGNYLVNWCPFSQSAISDEEVEYREVNGKLWHFLYPVKGLNQSIRVATTRPETMLGDTAVAVHPEDPRYREWVGKTVILPLVGREIPIVADDYVDKDFGSGAVKVTPSHDPNDFQIGVRHSLSFINIMNPNATLNGNVPPKYRGLDRFEARRLVVADMEAAGLLEKVEDHVNRVGYSQRGNVPIEPLMSDQWFLKMSDLAKPALDAVLEGRIRFYPEKWIKTYEHWMRNIKDWCVSRQLWWGHRIPAYYAPDGTVAVAATREEALRILREKHPQLSDAEMRQDEDVLDTWFSSWLVPFSSFGWPDRTKELEYFYPTSLLVTGPDIIFFWVARMIMMGLKFAGDVPFREVYITGLIRDEHGNKMSKSKGNIIDPLDLIDGIDLESLVAKRTSGLMQPHLAPQIEKATRRQFPAGIPEFGTDALRFTFAALASTGRDIRFDLNRIEGYRNFCNKLWNATRFVLMNVEGRTLAPPGGADTTLPGRWIRSRFGKALGTVHEQLAAYRFDLAARALYEFTWNEYCDWYLELTKPVLQATDPTDTEQAATRRSLIAMLEALLRALHPLMPFITEELWQRCAPVAGAAGETVMLQPYPVAADFPADDAAEAELAWLQGFVLGIRQIRGEMNIAPARPLPVILHGASETDRARLASHEACLRQLARLDSVSLLDSDKPAPAAALALLGGTRILVPIAGLIDIAAERERLGKALARAEAEVTRVEGKLANRQFADHAPAPVVARERDKLAAARQEAAQLAEQLARLATPG